MEKDKLKTCISYCQVAYEELERAKEDCTAKVEAALLEFVGSSSTKITNADKKTIKKIAKAKATDKLDDLKREVASDVDLLEESGICTHGQLSIFGPIKRISDLVEKEGMQMNLNLGETKSTAGHVN